MRIYGIYDSDYYEECITVGTLPEISKFLNMPARSIDWAVRNKKIGKYDFVYIFNEK